MKVSAYIKKIKVNVMAIKIGIGTNLRLSGGGSVSWSSYCPKQLIETADTFIEEAESTSGWAGASAAVDLNTTDKHGGSASIRGTTSVSGARIEKTMSCDMSRDSGASFRIWIFPEANAAVTSNYFSIVLMEDLTLTNYHVCNAIVFSSLKAGEWNLLSNITWNASGSPTWNVIKMRISLTPKTGQTMVVSVDDISWGRVYKPAVIISFDDGHSSLVTKTLPLFNNKRMVATAYIIGGNNNSAIEPYFNNMVERGWAIANHTQTHVDLTTLTQEQQEAEFQACKDYLDGLGLSGASDCIGYPFGAYNADTLAACASFGARIGRKAQGTGCGVTYMQTYYEDLTMMFPYKVNCYGLGYPTTLQTVKDHIDLSLLKSGVVISIVLHVIVDSDPAASQWTTQELSDLLDFFELRGIQTLNIDEYYRLNSEAITVFHK